MLLFWNPSSRRAAISEPEGKPRERTATNMRHTQKGLPSPEIVGAASALLRAACQSSLPPSLTDQHAT